MNDVLFEKVEEVVRLTILPVSSFESCITKSENIEYELYYVFSYIYL